MNYKKAKEKWVKEKLYSFDLYYREHDCYGNFKENHKICSWDRNFNIWYFPLNCDNLTGCLKSVHNFFWNLGENSIDKFYKIRKHVFINKNESFFADNYKTYKTK